MEKENKKQIERELKQEQKKRDENAFFIWLQGYTYLKNKIKL